MVCYRCKSDNVTAFSKADLYFKTWGPLNIKNHINAELVYLCNECQSALILIHILDDYSRHNRSTAHYPQLRVPFTNAFTERMKEFDKARGELNLICNNIFHDGFEEYVFSRMSNFFKLTKTPVKEYVIRDIRIECSESVGECKINPFTCKYCGQAAHDQMEANCGIGHAFTFDECPKRIRDRTMYVDLDGHEVEV